MIKDLFRNYIYPIATLSGSIIGVGFLSLPYIALKVGIEPMFFYFLVLTSLVVFIHLIFGEISLKTPDFKRFPGFVGFYLGRFPKAIALTLSVFGLLGVLLAYLIVGSQFLAAALSPFLGGNILLYVFLYFLAVSSVIYFDVKAISKIEFLSLCFLFVALIAIFLKFFGQIKTENIFLNNSPIAKDWRTMFLPYGALLFSLWGTGLIPEVEEMLVGNKKLLKKIIALSTLIPAIVYFLFILLVLGITGAQTTDSALAGLKNFLGEGTASAILFIGVITTFTAFIAQGLLLKKTFIYDMGFKKFTAWFLACFVPLILLIAGINAFIPLISFLGGVFVGISGILILLMYGKIGGKKIIVYPLMLIFILGIIYEIAYFIK